MKKLLIALSVLSAALVYADVPLMKNGSPACSIVPAPGDDPRAGRRGLIRMARGIPPDRPCAFPPRFSPPVPRFPKYSIF